MNKIESIKCHIGEVLFSLQTAKRVEDINYLSSELEKAKKDLLSELEKQANE